MHFIIYTSIKHTAQYLGLISAQVITITTPNYFAKQLCGLSILQKLDYICPFKKLQRCQLSKKFEEIANIIIWNEYK